MGTSRRAFFQMASVLFPSFLLSPFSVFRSLLAPEGELRTIKRPRPNPFVKGGKTLVSVVGGNDVGKMVRECVELIGGIEKLKVRGRTVLVKPNVVSGAPPPTTTNPEVVKHTVRLLYDAGAKKVIVGDMSALVAMPTGQNLEKTGIKKVASEAGAEVIDFDDVDWIEVKPPEVRLVRSIHVARPVYEAEVFVNLPVVKTHRNASYSICLKNMVGVTHPRYRPYRVNWMKWEEVVAEMNLCAHPDLNIVDATTVMVAGGPWSGTAEKTDMILASGDRIAADVVGLGLIKSFGKWDDVTKIGVWEQRQIRHAQWLRLGIQEKKSLEMVTKLLEGPEEQFSRLITQIQGFIEA
jgi:uncharacterized protein (DUF362 family)